MHDVLMFCRVCANPQVFHLPVLAVYNQSSFPTGIVSLPFLRSIFVRESIDVVHAHSAFSSLGNEALIIAGMLGIHTVFTDHSLFGFSDVSAIVTNRVLQFTLANVSNVICVSHTGRENTALRSGVDTNRITVIPNAIDPCSFRPRSRPQPLHGTHSPTSLQSASPSLLHRARGRGTAISETSSQRVTIAVVSRLVYRKGIDLLARVIPRICASFPHVDFVVGGGGPKRVILDEAREAHNLQQRVTMLGAVPHDQVRDVMCDADVFLNVSLTEAFCIAIVEAASCGLLVVSTAVGGVPEVLPPDMLTLAVPTVDGICDAVAAALARVPHRREHDRVVQHERVAAMYDWRVVAERTERVYTDTLAQPVPDCGARLERVWALGRVAGPILMCYCVLLELVLMLVVWCTPPVAPRPTCAWPCCHDETGPKENTR